MRILLIVAGIFDPKWPLPAFAASELPLCPEDKLVLSPFEEAALELGLRTRDADREHVVLSAVVCGATTEKLARAIGSYNIADVVRLDLDRTDSGMCRALWMLWRPSPKPAPPSILSFSVGKSATVTMVCLLPCWPRGCDGHSSGWLKTYNSQQVRPLSFASAARAKNISSSTAQRSSALPTIAATAYADR